MEASQDHSGAHVYIKLTSDEALVLSDWLGRGRADDLPCDHEAEKVVVWRLEAVLEKILVEPFKADYSDLLKDSRERLLQSDG